MPNRSGDIPTAVRKAVYERDAYRCRWCGRTNAGVDLHHIEYRSSGGKHVPDNLITLCRQHHSLAHTDKGYYPPLLAQLVERPGVTGLQLERWRSHP